MEHFRFFFFLPLIIAFATYAQTAQHEQPFIFSDEFNNTQELIIGYDPFGTNGLDPDLGEIIIPQVPPGEFGVRFQLPPDTSITTIKDIRFGCPWPGYYEHLVELRYMTGSTTIEMNWNWSSSLMWLIFINSTNGDTLANLQSFVDPPYFNISLPLEKIKMVALYDIPLSWPEYRLYTPNGGEIIEGGSTYDITWWYNQLGFNFANIAFSSDSGSSWDIIADTILSTQNNYNWSVPNINSESCLIRIGDYPCAYDQSDSFFTITYPVSINDEESIPTEFSLAQNYPNPFNPTTTIKFSIPKSVILSEAKNLVTLKVYDVLGNELATLVSEEKPAGTHTIEFDATGLPSGVYFYILQAGNYFETKKMVLLK